MKNDQTRSVAWWKRHGMPVRMPLLLKPYVLMGCLLMALLTQAISAGAAITKNEIGVSVPPDMIVTGTVTDMTGFALAGVTVMEKGTSNGVATDIDGHYSIKVESNASVLVFSFIGMSTEERIVGSQTTVDVQMQDDLTTLESVVVVGYGTQRKKALTTSVAQVKSEEFNAGLVSNPMDLVMGKVAGLTITRTMNNPTSDDGLAIQLRGVTSISGGTGPLIVIDGIPGGNLNLIQPNDIESIDVLKDGSAAAIYGTRGNNGVILITTKKGKGGSTQFEYAGSVSRDYVNESAMPDFLSAKEWRQAISDGLMGETYDFGSSSDLMDMLTNKENLSQYHNLSAAGGGDNGNFRASLYYRDLQGIAKENEKDNIGGRLNYTLYGMNDKLTFKGSVSANHSNSNLLGGDDWGNITSWNPTSPIYSDGSVNDKGQYAYFEAENGTNPLSQYAYELNERDQLIFSSDFTLGYEFMDGLDVSVFGAYQRNAYTDRLYRSTKSYTQYNSSTYQGTAYASKNNYLQWTKMIEPTIKYKKSFGLHSLEALGGYSYQYTTTEQYGMGVSGITTDASEDWNLAAANALASDDYPNPTMTSSKGDNTLIAFFGRVNYAFQDRYFFQASLRHEGSSRFGANNKWGNFPSVSAGWLMSDESFMSGIEFVSTLKLRAGFGVTGNQDIGNYLSLNTVGTGMKYLFYYDDLDEPTYYTTYGATKNVNPNLKWEKKNEIDIGVDFGLFGNKITGSLDYYNRKTNDLLYTYTAQIPANVLKPITANVGSIRNNGVELALSTTALDRHGVKWNVSLTGSYQHAVVTSLANSNYSSVSSIAAGAIGNPGSLGNAYLIDEGVRVGEYYGLKSAGLSEDGQWLFYLADGSIGTSSEASDDDKRYIGNGLPKFNASWTNTISYKGFDLTVFLRGKFGYKILNNLRMFYSNPTLIGTYNVMRSAINNVGKINESPIYSSYYLENGSFVKLDNVTLAYNFNFPSKVAIRALRVYVTGRNLATITSYTGRDPEVGDTGLTPGMDDRVYYPRTKTISIGLNASF